MTEIIDNTGYIFDYEVQSQGSQSGILFTPNVKCLLVSIRAKNSLHNNQNYGYLYLNSNKNILVGPILPAADGDYDVYLVDEVLTVGTDYIFNVGARDVFEWEDREQGTFSSFPIIGNNVTITAESSYSFSTSTFKTALSVGRNIVSITTEKIIAF